MKVVKDTDQRHFIVDLKGFPGGKTEPDLSDVVQKRRSRTHLFFCSCRAKQFAPTRSYGSPAWLFEVVENDTKGLSRLILRRLTRAGRLPGLIFARDRCRDEHVNCPTTNRGNSDLDLSRLGPHALLYPLSDREHMARDERRDDPDGRIQWETFDQVAAHLFTEASVDVFRDALESGGQANSLVGFFQRAAHYLGELRLYGRYNLLARAEKLGVELVLGVLDDLTDFKDALIRGPSEFVFLPAFAFRGARFQRICPLVKTSDLDRVVRMWRTGEHTVRGPYVIMLTLHRNRNLVLRIHIQPCSIFGDRFLLCESHLERLAAIQEMMLGHNVLKFPRGREFGALPAWLQDLLKTQTLPSKWKPDLLGLDKASRPFWREVFGGTRPEYVEGTPAKLDVGRKWEKAGHGTFIATLPADLKGVDIPIWTLPLMECSDTVSAALRHLHSVPLPIAAA